MHQSYYSSRDSSAMGQTDPKPLLSSQQFDREDCGCRARMDGETYGRRNDTVNCRL